jgi:hypothetical protein
MKKKSATINRTDWIDKLMSNGFIEVHPKGGRPKPRHRLFMNATIAGHSVVVEPEHPAFRSWTDIQKHIDRQLK